MPSNHVGLLRGGELFGDDDTIGRSGDRALTSSWCGNKLRSRVQGASSVGFRGAAAMSNAA